MKSFAEQWVRRWNALDIAGVLSEMSEDAVFVSPVAADVVGTAELAGRPAIEAYWREAATRIGKFRFEYRDLVWDPERSNLVILYVSHRESVSQRAAELLRFEGGQIVYGEGLYGAFF